MKYRNNQFKQKGDNIEKIKAFVCFGCRRHLSDGMR